MNITQLGILRTIFIFFFLIIAFIVSEYSFQKDTYNYLQTISEWEGGGFNILTRTYFFIGFVSYLDTLSFLTGVQVMHAFIASVIAVFFSRIVRTPLDALLILTLAVSPLLSDNYRGVIRQGFGFSLFLIGLMVSNKPIKSIFFLFSFFIHNLLSVPLIALGVVFIYKKFVTFLNLSNQQRPVLFSFLVFFGCSILSYILWFNILPINNLSQGFDDSKSGLDFIYFLGFFFILSLFRQLNNHNFYYETLLILGLYLSIYFFLTGGPRILMVGLPFIFLFIGSIERISFRYFFLLILSVHSLIRISMNPTNFIA